nr:class I SAM-dependent methyltransferase [Oceanococcus sp. HetDA_MAG_MS8]
MSSTLQAGFYERRILPWLIDCACGLPAVERQRAKVVPLASGRVLEIGIGTGRNLRHYNVSQVDSLLGLDPSLAWHPLAKRRLASIDLPVEPLALSAETIPLDDASVDSVVCTYTLCTIPDPQAALAEFRRVLKPTGKLLFSEHGLAPDATVRRWQHRIEPIWKPFVGGCHLTRDTRGLLLDSGFAIDDIDQRYLRGPRPMTYNSRGVAHKR